MIDTYKPTAPPVPKPQPTGPDYHRCTCNWIKTVDGKATRVFGGTCEIH